MLGAGIFDGDLLLVDRSIEPRHGQIVVASINDEFTVKRLHHIGNEIKLLAANPNFDDITLKEFDNLSVWGVVTFSLKRF
jgi:DNA polymerase V